MSDLRDIIARKANLADLKTLNESCVEIVKRQVDDSLDEFDDYLK